MTTLAGVSWGPVLTCFAAVAALKLLRRPGVRALLSRAVRRG